MAERTSPATRAREKKTARRRERRRAAAETQRRGPSKEKVKLRPAGVKNSGTPPLV